MQQSNPDQQDVADISQLWSERVESRFNFNKNRFVRDLQGEVTPSVYFSIFKDKGNLSTRLAKRGSHWERVFVHTFDPNGKYIFNFLVTNFIDSIPMLSPDWREKIVIYDGERKHLKVNYNDVSTIKKNLSQKRAQAKKRKLDLQQLTEEIEERTTKLNSIQNRRSEEFQMQNYQLIKKKEEQNNLLESEKWKRKIGGKSSPTPVQFIYNYDKHNLAFRFDFTEYSENGNTVPF